MPKIGEMKIWKNVETGEVFGWNIDLMDVPIPQCQAVENEAQTGELAPHLILQVKSRHGVRPVGCAWKRGPDRKGNTYYEIKLDGHPMQTAMYMRAFATDDPELFEVNYSAGRPARSAA